MAFPNVIVDCAFDNDINESMYAQTGYSDITPWVKTISGTLRGRTYEMDQVETGSLRIALDNSDGRFSPEDARSPYYPNVRPARRLRIRGLNLQRPNVAAAGSLSHDEHGFMPSSIWTSTPAPKAVVNGGTSAFTTPPTGAGTYHIEAVLPAGAVGSYSLLQFNLPVEAGRNMRHSIYSWRVSGTEPAASVGFYVVYLDANSEVLSTGSTRWANATSTTPTEHHVDSTCPVDAAYAIGVFGVSATAAITAPVTYALEKISSVYTPNIAANPVVYVDANAPITADHWYVDGPHKTDVYADNGGGYVYSIMASDVTDTALYTLINGTIPGVSYDVSIDVAQYTAAWGTPSSGDLFVSADGGRSGATVPGRGSWSTAAFTFIADKDTTKLTVELAADTAYANGWHVCAENVTIYPTGESHSFPDWEMPKAIFEGWVEAWPVRAEAMTSTISIVVNDRLKRLGDTTLGSPWSEQEISRGAVLVLPLDDSPVGDRGHGGTSNDEVALAGAWANASQIIVAPIEATHGSLAGCTYSLGVPGPAGADSSAIDLTTAGTGYNGYFIPIPFSLDYVAPPTPPVMVRQPGKPRPAVPTYAWRAYTTNFYSTWSQSYNADDTQYSSPYCYQGYYAASPHGNTTSLVGFNNKQIQAVLSGTTVLSCRAVFYAEHWYWSAGGWVVLGTHTFNAKPATWDPAHVQAARFGGGTWPSGTIEIPRDHTLVYDMGFGIGKEFQRWACGGLAFGPGPSTDHMYYGYFRGATQSGRPYLSITYNRRVQVS